MGRLFWKFLLAFWTSLITVVALVSIVFLVLRSMNVEPLPSMTRLRAEFMVRTISALLEDGDVSAASSVMRGWQNDHVAPQVYAVDAAGHDLLGRALPTEVSDEVRKRAASDAPAGLSRSVESALGSTFDVVVGPEDVRAAGGLPPGPAGPPVFAPLITAAVISLLASGLLAWSFAKPIRNLRWALHAVAAGHLDTRVQPLMGTRRDEIADLGADFDRMADRLQLLMAAQRQLLHDVSHELRSPLARMQAAIGLARQQPDRAAELMDRVERETGRLDRLVGELLTLARLEAGIEDAARERVDVVDLIVAVADDARFEAQSSHRDLHLKVDGTFIVDANAEVLARAFENVIRNAVKYTAKCTTVEVEVAAETERLVLHVRDRGPGIPGEEFETMFKPFRQFGGNRAQGAGLGLAIARRAVSAHGGVVVPSAREGGGLVMSIELTRDGLLPDAP
jgi:two-component system, OmpR family, sensor kinase